MYQVIIVEGDPMVSYISREYVEKDGRFCVTGEFRSGKEALAFLEQNGVDLMLLDLCMSGYTGEQLLRDILVKNIDVDAIVLTAARDMDSLDEALRLGVLDYLLKPFSGERLQKALGKYCDYRQTLDGLRSVDQESVDYLLHIAEARPATEAESATEAKIMSCFKKRPSHGFTVKEFSGSLGVSEVTVRRYLKRLVEAGRITGDIDYQTGGHPRAVYRLP